MEGFQKIVLYAAIIILIISLVFIGITLSYAKDSKAWPPIVPNCPDYWAIEGSGDNARCINVKDLGKCKPNGKDKHLSMNFNDSPYVGDKGLCSKYEWANRCGVSWDGVNYGVNNPCQVA
jgi:hypothetical protein